MKKPSYKSLLLFLLFTPCVAFLAWVAIGRGPVFCKLVIQAFTPVRPGQVWLYTINEDNPFETPSYYTNYVLDVKRGYVRYIGGFWSGTNTANIDWFKTGSRLLRP